MRLPKQVKQVHRTLDVQASTGDVAPAGIFGTIAKMAVPLLGGLL